mmetsp:Transcript_121534/g.388845  ORF Transcript_121534/g.388845 Transcript_121534/m.388845 type:complete len:417 (-) Transcript_121534:97-1347(-)
MAAGAQPPAALERLFVAVLGNSGSGKTKLLESLLHKCGTAPDGLGGATASLTSPAGGRAYALAERPGDAEGLRRLAAGSFYGDADAALFVASAAPGELEAGLGAEGRTREAAVLARAMGCERAVVAVTKMDAGESAYSESRYRVAKESISEVLRAAGFMEEVSFVPVSAAIGANLAEGLAPEMPWYVGPTLLQALDALPSPERPTHAPLRVTVREAYHLEGVGAVAVGRVEQGCLRLGAQLQFSPGNASGKVRTIEVDGATVREAGPRDEVTFVPEGVEVAALRRGMVAAEAGQPMVEVESFLAHLTVLRGPGEVRVGYSPVLVCHNAQVVCCIEELVAKLDRRDGARLEERPVALRAGDVGLVRLRPEQPLAVEPHAACPRLGQFASPPEQTALALVGIVVEVVPKPSGGEPPTG